jgi:hypothetical protein
MALGDVVIVVAVFIKLCGKSVFLQLLGAKQFIMSQTVVPTKL